MPEYERGPELVHLQNVKVGGMGKVEIVHNKRTVGFFAAVSASVKSAAWRVHLAAGTGVMPIYAFSTSASPYEMI